MLLTKYGFPMKVKIVNRKPGRPKKKTLIKQDVYEAFCEWAAQPTPLRDAKTAKDFAVKWGVTQKTLVTWKKRQDFWEKVAAWRISWAKDKTSDVIHALFKRASLRGESGEVKLWMQLIEDWSEKQIAPTPNITVIGIRGISGEELRKITEKPQEGGIIEEAEVVENV